MVHVGAESAHEKDLPVTLTQEDLAKNLKLLPTSPALWAGRTAPFSMDYIELRQCKLGEVCWVTAVSRPDICARLARIASRIDALCGSDVFRIDELVRVTRDWQQATALECASPSHPWRAPGLSDKVDKDLWKRGDGGGGFGVVQ